MGPLRKTLVASGYRPFGVRGTRAPDRRQPEALARVDPHAERGLEGPAQDQRLRGPVADQAPSVQEERAGEELQCRAQVVQRGEDGVALAVEAGEQGEQLELSPDVERRG